MTDTEELANALSRIGVRDPRPVTGGDISLAFRAACAYGECFVKCVSDGDPRLLPCEATALEKLREVFAGVVPQVYFVDSRFLVLQWLDLRPRCAVVDAELGRLLAKMHRHQAAQHGWMEDNFIGRSPQRNLSRTGDWTRFFIDCRIVPQLQWLGDAGHTEFIENLDALMDVCERLLGDHAPAPSLLHGDLWGGNAAATAGGHPALYDPACSYGDRETDLAMCRLFGGFFPQFFDAYQQAYPLSSDWQSRVGLYQLYHVLNHASLSAVPGTIALFSRFTDCCSWFLCGKGLPFAFRTRDLNFAKSRSVPFQQVEMPAGHGWPVVGVRGNENVRFRPSVALLWVA